MREHFRRNWERYALGGTLVAGFTLLVMRGRHADMQSVSDGSAMITVRPFSIFSNKQITNVVTVIEREGRGHPGYLVRCLETGQTFISQAEAASVMNVSPSMLSSHINGSFDNVNGLHFHRLAA